MIVINDQRVVLKGGMRDVIFVNITNSTAITLLLCEGFYVSY